MVDYIWHLLSSRIFLSPLFSASVAVFVFIFTEMYGCREIPRFIAHRISALGGEVNYHKFGSQLNRFHPLRFFASLDPGIIQENFSCSSYGTITVGIIRAPCGDGKEAIVLVTPYNSAKISTG
ncbi:hypothetical protein ACH5RR_014466 [Cinchona calisaya]|uniref:Uncharacterized protein n=1 Tax=Cinchona calisaya TaxID=153742 RepID=A0ABD3A2Y0_9GENT